MAQTVLTSASATPIARTRRHTNNSEETRYNPNVASKEITMSRKMWLLNMFAINVLFGSCWMWFNPLKVRKSAENYAQCRSSDI